MSKRNNIRGKEILEIAEVRENLNYNLSVAEVIKFIKR